MGIFNPAGSVKRWTMAALGENRNLANENLSNLQPYSSQGGAAWGKYGDLLGLNGQGAADAAMSGYRASPGYQYQLDQGTQAIDRSAAARGNMNSGATLKALQGYGQNLADQDFGNYLNRLSGAAGVGYGATNAENAVRTGLGNTIMGAYGNIGNAVANQSIGQMNMLGSLIGNGLFGGGSGGGGGGVASLAKLFM